VPADRDERPTWRERARAEHGDSARAFLESLGPDEPETPPADPYDGPVPAWRTGRKVGNTIYRQVGAEASDDDVLIGVMFEPEFAAHAVKAVNGQRSRLKHGGGNGEDCPICCWRKDLYPFICDGGES
jgi:hypothetical protein